MFCVHTFCGSIHIFSFIIPFLQSEQFYIEFLEFYVFLTKTKNPVNFLFPNLGSRLFEQTNGIRIVLSTLFCRSLFDPLNCCHGYRSENLNAFHLELLKLGLPPPTGCSVPRPRTLLDWISIANWLSSYLKKKFSYYSMMHYNRKSLR